MTKAPRVTAEQVLRALRRDRWEERKTSATSHRHLTHPVKPGVVAVPYHRGGYHQAQDVAEHRADSGSEHGPIPGVAVRRGVPPDLRPR